MVTSYSVMTGGIEYPPFKYIFLYLFVGRMTPERLCVIVSLSYFFFVKTGKIRCWVSIMSVSVGQYTMVVNPSTAFFRARVRSSGLVVNMVVYSRGENLTCYIEEHRGIVGNTIIRLDNGAFLGLIY